MAFHSYLTVLIPAIVAFLVTLAATKFIIGFMSNAGIVTMERNKGRRWYPLPSGAGPAVALGFAVGILAYIFGGSFGIYTPEASLPYLYAALLSILLISFVGFLDDIVVEKEVVLPGKVHKVGKGLKQWQKPLLTLIGAIPLMAINAGVSMITIPFFGTVDFGIIYPLVLIPLAVVFSSNAFNLLGGFDGIAAGSGLIAAIGFLIYSLYFGTYTGAVLSGVLVASLLAFFFFTIYPTKLIPGDSFTYLVGTAFIAAMVLGNMEAFGVIVIFPWFIEFLLHLRGRFRTSDLGIRQSDGTFKAPYDGRIYSWTHAFMNLKRCREWEVSLYMWIVEIAFVLLAFGLKSLALL